MNGTPPRRSLGIDLGERRIGLAIREDSGAPRGLPTMMRRPTASADAERLRTIVAEGRVTELVVGLPLHSDGSVSPQATATLHWATEVAHTLQLPIIFVDERYSSQRAEASLGRAARGSNGGAPGPARREARRAAVDQEAARLILEDALNPELLVDPTTLAVDVRESTK
ncbi:MAG: Holliday junction resolvase RuvX [Chloroflexi bacterium]|nr:Holliday junction resolvase RuvX [Chloroflexota bacterium]